MKATRTDTRPQPFEGKAGWKARNDRGPHTATFPSGQQITFIVPDSGALIRAGRLPERLKHVALMCAGHSGGAEGYLDDLIAVAMRHDRVEETLARSIEEGLAIGHHLIAEMVISPAITVEDVASGELPEPDLRMLLEFAERKRNTDVLGVKLPILLLDEWATFRGQPPGTPGTPDDANPAEDAPGSVPDPDSPAL